MVVDAHTHRYREYPDGSLQVVNVVTRGEYEMLKNRRGVKTSYGLHPWKIGEEEIDWVLLEDVDMVGEIGLDKAISVPMEKQVEVFEEQLRFAKERGKGVIVHCVRAYNEVMVSMKRVGYGGKAVFHGYRSTLEMAKQLMRCCDAEFSFGERELKVEKYKKVREGLPREKVFWESDDAE
ncbi:MAG: TatD family hydrolase [Bacteroidales bacterium]|nr:TatD family hydrolase [Bacteroidales bacterium]